MILDVSPTGMELLRLKKKLRTARRGHKLLKDKLEELIRCLISLLKEIDKLQTEIEEKFARLKQILVLSENHTLPQAMLHALTVPEHAYFLEASHTRLLNIKLPLFTFKDKEEHPGYGFIQTSAGLDQALDIFRKIFPVLIDNAAKEKSAYLIADEIEKTKRRVNALEYILIPNIEETIKFIAMKLQEQERNAQAQLMRIKDVVRLPMSRTTGNRGFKFYPFFK